MSARFSDQLRQKCDAVWEAQHQHPFVCGLGDGTLEPGRFQVWLRQHFLCRVEFARLFSVAAARTAELETMKWLVAMAHVVLHQEMLLHQAYAIELGIQAEDLAASVRLLTTRAYTDHLLRTATLGSYLEMVAAMLPGPWGHYEIAQRLAGPERRSLDGPYSRWVQVYSGPVVADLTRKGRDLLDRLAGSAGPLERIAAEEAFATSSHYERLFWDMCYAGAPT